MLRKEESIASEDSNKAVVTSYLVQPIIRREQSKDNYDEHTTEFQGINGRYGIRVDRNRIYVDRHDIYVDISSDCDDSDNNYNTSNNRYGSNANDDDDEYRNNVDAADLSNFNNANYKADHNNNTDSENDIRYSSGGGVKSSYSQGIKGD